MCLSINNTKLEHLYLSDLPSDINSFSRLSGNSINFKHLKIALFFDNGNGYELLIVHINVLLGNEEIVLI